MQDQITPGQSNLQQSSSNLQPNSSNIQQSGTPPTSSEVFTLLSQDAQQGLQVQSAQTDPNAVSQTYLPEQTTGAWIVPVVFVGAVIAAVVLWMRLRVSEPDIVEPVADAPEPKAKPIRKKTKSGKKTTRRKRQANR